MSYWRVASKARSKIVAIEGLFSGCSAFLIGGSPRLLELDYRLMKMPGVWSMAINNAALWVEPQAFIAIDPAKCFNQNIFSNPRIIKLFSYLRHDEIVSGKRLSHYPNTLFFDSKNEYQMMMSECCNEVGPLPFWNATIFTALVALYQFGFKNIYLIGCTFDTPGYEHTQKISEFDKTVNEKLNDSVIENMSKLVPMMNDEGMNIKTCHINSRLDGIVDYVSFQDAVSLMSLEATSVDFNKLRHNRNIE